jgi:AcrR family transcriptional regulator
MDRIARRAKVSKRMLFYYFRSKQDLFEVVIRLAWNNGEIIHSSPEAPVEISPFFASWHFDNPEWTKLLGWEGLEWKKQSIRRVNDRRHYWKRALEINTSGVGPGKWPAELNPSFILFGLVAMEMAPVLFPNLAYLILEKDTNDPQFKKDWVSFMAAFNRSLMRVDLDPKADDKSST